MRLKKLISWLQKPMRYTRVTLNPMVDIMLVSRYLINTKSDFIKMFNLNIVYTNAMGFRVTMAMVDHMHLLAMAAEAHVIHQDDAETDGFGQDHGGVNIMSFLILRLDKAPIF